MSPPVPRRSHLVERAADAARAAIVADTPVARVPRPPLAPVEVLPAAVETVVPPAPPSQAASPPRRNDPAPVSGALLRSAGPLRRNDPDPVTVALLHGAGLVSEAGPAREEIALVREQVLRSVEATPPADGRQARLVVVTSSRGGEGKSFVALNLAASIAEGTHRPVILADAERGAGSLTNLLGLSGEPGLEQLRDTGEPDPAGLLRRTEVSGLLVLPHGTAPAPGEQGSALAAALLHLARRLSDHIIVLDTPACLESSIAGVVAAAAGQIALVVQAERTKRAEVEAALDILNACPTLQLLLNRSALRVSDGFRGPAPNASDVAASADRA